MKHAAFTTISLVSISTLFFILPGTARAQTLSLSVSPPLIEIFTQPNHPLAFQYTVKNRGADSAFVSSLLSYTTHGLEELDPNDTSPTWIHWTDPTVSWNKPFSLRAGEEKTVTLTISPDSAVKEQDYYRAVTFRTIPPPGSEFSQTGVEAEVSSVVLATITSSGNVAKSAQIEHFELPSFIDSFGPLPISIDVKNNGNVFTRVTGQLTLRGPIGTGTYVLEPHILLSQETRRVAITTGTEHVPQSSSTALIHGLFLGKYTVATTIQLDQSAHTLAQQKTVYALPWKLLLAIITSIILLRYLVFFRKRG